MKPPRISEKHEQQAIVDYLRLIGAEVYVLGHPSPNDGRSHRGTGQTSGLADILAFVREPHPPWTHRAVWIEVKAADGGLSDAQVRFRQMCDASAQPYISGTCEDVMRYFREMGWGR